MYSRHVTIWKHISFTQQKGNFLFCFGIFYNFPPFFDSAIRQLLLCCQINNFSFKIITTKKTTFFLFGNSSSLLLYCLWKKQNSGKMSTPKELFSEFNVWRMKESPEFASLVRHMTCMIAEFSFTQNIPLKIWLKCRALFPNKVRARKTLISWKLPMIGRQLWPQFRPWAVHGGEVPGQSEYLPNLLGANAEDDERRLRIVFQGQAQPQAIRSRTQHLHFGIWISRVRWPFSF